MKKKFCLLIFTVLALFYSFSPAVFAATSYSYDISYFEITVDPREDTSLDVIHSLKVEILNCSEPVNWLKLEIHNLDIDELKAVSKNISEIRFYSENDKNYIRIDLNKNYSKGDVIELKYSFHQSNSSIITEDTIKYSYTIGSFSNTNVNELKVLWNAKNAIVATTPNINSKNYYVWNSSLPKEEKLNIYVEYPVQDSQVEVDVSEESSNSEDSGVSFADWWSSWWSWGSFVVGIVATLIFLGCIAFFC